MLSLVKAFHIVAASLVRHALAHCDRPVLCVQSVLDPGDGQAALPSEVMSPHSAGSRVNRHRS